MKATIIGANGTIGNAVLHALAAGGFSCTGLTSQRDTAFTTVTYTLDALGEHLVHADAVLYCIGVSKFAECEADPATSHYLNVQLPHAILQSMAPHQRFVYLSSPIAIYDFQALPPPRYAQQKRQAESLLLASVQPHPLIVRPSKIIESLGVLREWKQRLEHQQSITAFSDQFLAPIRAADLAECIGALLAGGHTGCYNFSAADRMGYHEIAQMLCAHFGYDSAHVLTTSARESNPFFFQQDILDCRAAIQAIGYAPPHSRDIIFDYIGKLA